MRAGLFLLMLKSLASPTKSMDIVLFSFTSSPIWAFVYVSRAMEAAKRLSMRLSDSMFPNDLRAAVQRMSCKAGAREKGKP